MRVTMNDIKKRLNELDGDDGEPITVIVEARCTNNLEIEGELIHSFKVTYYSDGHTEHEDLFNSDNKTNMEGNGNGK